MTKWLDQLKGRLMGAASDAAEPIWKFSGEDESILNLSSQGLTELPEAVTQAAHLTELNLGHNKLTRLPDSIGNLTQLRSLNLVGNNLEELPESIGQLKQLERLILVHNKLVALPESIGQLKNLTYLDLVNNKLTTLPDSIGELTQLQFLYLDKNQLAELPASIRNLKSLSLLWLHGNDALGIPEEVLGSPRGATGARDTNPSEILDYYFRTRGGKRPLNEAKLILVGRGTVGKTSIVNRLVHNRFERDEKKTEGIKITNWGIKLNGTEDVRLNVWDFGGQEIMHATHQFFLTKRSVYLLVLSGREGVEDVDADYWLKLIESFGGESPVIVVLNKIKAHPFDVNRRGLQAKYPFIRFVIKTDCEDGTGIKELREAIEQETDVLDDLRAAFPASWFSIKDKLAGMKKNYLNFNEYRKFCEENGETDKDAQESLAGFLHRLGIVLNYRDDARLQDTHVLNPHWMTEGIYKIINSKKLEAQQGEIRLSDLAEILNADDYPSHMRRFIFDLMKKFELCFSFPDDDTRYLIPELLGKEEPEETAEFAAGECLKFQYHYPILPEGLLPRFIVRTHALSEGLPRWRTGVVLAFEDCHAVVKADVQDKKVFISIYGLPENRRRLLAVVRSDFERIHHDIRNLQPLEMVPLPAHPDVVVPYEDLLLWEKEGRQTYPVRVGNSIHDVNVRELLSGVTLEGERKREMPVDIRREAVRLFISYSHKDERLRNELEAHLKILQRQGLVDVWHDRKIRAGENWAEQIDENLERAHIILLLISSDFIASDYIHKVELKRAMEKESKGEARVINVILRDVDWQPAEFARLQSLPRDGRPVTRWRPKDTAWRNVAEGIRQVVEEMRLTP